MRNLTSRSIVSPFAKLLKFGIWISDGLSWTVGGTNSSTRVVTTEMFWLSFVSLWRASRPAKLPGYCRCHSSVLFHAMFPSPSATYKSILILTGRFLINVQSVTCTSSIEISELLHGREYINVRSRHGPWVLVGIFSPLVSRTSSTGQLSCVNGDSERPVAHNRYKLKSHGRVQETYSVCEHTYAVVRHALFPDEFKRLTTW